jgi:type II secretory pathway predicted ATPase ExeA
VATGLLERDVELAELRSAIDGLHRGEGAIVLVSGEAGVGKTSLARAVLAATYPRLGLDWDPATVGSVADEVPGVTVAEVANALVPRLLSLITSSPTFPVIEARERPPRSADW